jgi:cytochrome c-type biogenesis protein CcmH
MRRRNPLPKNISRLSTTPPLIGVDTRVKPGHDGKKAVLPVTWRALPLLALLLCSPAHAVSDPREMLPNPAQEARAEQIGSQLRCLVCQNESIEESNADLARDLRAVVRKQVAAGDSDQQIMAWMVARYGSFVRLKPPLSAGTLLLWGMPVLAVMAGGLAAFLGRRRATVAPAPLSEAEQARLEELSRTA